MLVVRRWCSIARLGRYAGELLLLLDEQHKSGVLVRILNIPWFDYSAPIGRFIAQTFAAPADLKPEQTQERQPSDIEAGRQSSAERISRKPRI